MTVIRSMSPYAAHSLVCVVCGRAFISAQRTTRYCSDACTHFVTQPKRRPHVRRVLLFLLMRGRLGARMSKLHTVVTLELLGYAERIGEDRYRLTYDGIRFAADVLAEEDAEE